MMPVYTNGRTRRITDVSKLVIDREIIGVHTLSVF